MDFSRQRLSLNKAKEIDLVDYLFSLGHEPSQIRNNDYWYLSPLREEKTPSFKVNRKLNRWYDHGLGQGGNLIDFGIRYHQCPLHEFILNLSHSYSLPKPVFPPAKVQDQTDSKIRIRNDSPITSYALLEYLRQRCIPRMIAQQYCSEVRYELKDKIYYGIGFKNDSGGYEIRNPYFKISSSPKDITTYGNGSREVSVFEGFMDFLSFQTLHKNSPLNKQDFVVLNSVALFERARTFMENHESIQLFLDKDVTGRQITQNALSLNSKYTDKSDLYTGYKDVNDWLIHTAKFPKRQLRQGIR